MTLLTRGLLGLTLVASTLSADITADIFSALRRDDSQTVRSHIAAGLSPNIRDEHGTTPLMQATLYGSTGTMRMLLDKGADPNAANEAGATALMWAVHDINKVKLLIRRGADVNAASKEGRTALLIASRQAGSSATIRLLMKHGAKADARDALGGTALMMAAETGDIEMVRLLLDAGIDVNARAEALYGAPRFDALPPNMPKPAKSSGVDALMMASVTNNREIAKLLLERGATPKTKTFMGWTALLMAVRHGDLELVRMLINHGADVNAREFRGATPLILAAAADGTKPEVLQLLLEKGADPDVRDRFRNRTAKEWADLRRATSEPSEVAVTPVKGTPNNDPRRAVEMSLPLLHSSGTGFFKQSGCISCHNNSISQIAIATARQRRFQIDEKAAAYQVKFTASVVKPHVETMLQAIPSIPASPIVSGYALLGMAAEGYPADRATDALVHELAARQRLDGSWFPDNQRPPLDQGQFLSTALAMRALQLYPLPGRRAELQKRVERARQWFVSATPVTTQDAAMKLLGLAWAHAQPAAVRRAAQDLLNLQRADGGWSQLSQLESDAFATGQALYALYSSGALRPSDKQYALGMQFLVSSQLPDGSWHVKTRALGFQKYFESGYPHGHDQWISAGAAAWATAALAAGTEPAQFRARR